MKIFRLIFKDKHSGNEVSLDGKRKIIENMFGEEDKYNQFYGNASLAYRFLSFLMVVCFLFCIIAASFLNANSFTLSNLEYICRNFALQLEANENDSVYAIKYNPDTSRNYSLFKDGLVVSGSNGLTVFSATGRITANEAINYINPKMLAGDKYILIFDSMGKSYTVYNTFSSVYSSTLEHTILGAAIADNGYYALITSSDEYNSSVELYNNDFELIYRINKNGYITSLCMTDSISVICTVNVDSFGRFSSETMIFDYITGTELGNTESISDIPIYCEGSNESITVICESGVYIYDYNCNTIGKYLFTEQLLSNFSCDSGYILMLFKNQGFNTDYSLICIDKSAEIIYEHTIEGTVFSVDLSDNISFVLTENQFIRISSDSVDRIDYSGADHDTELISIDSNNIYVCLSSSAPLIKFD